MSLLEEGFRFYSRPDRQEARWIHPTVKAHLQPDWIDVTDLGSEALVEFFTSKPLPHGQAECAKAQLDIFNDTKEPAA
ncbi:hypothetical protein LNN38_21175 [Pseudomonas sp. LA21]|uniref:hypothetical protein n=1 Tax=Pseudomonas sp. LA21 TaxID=2893373 RepID=UPI001FB7D1F7|nr:hypothetical protein [Pseudomonas sp. LA21]MCJ1887387.1 hypothetical protein [Pseudomonas sp. LA21]